LSGFGSGRIIPCTMASMNLWWYFWKFLPAALRVMLMTRSLTGSIRVVADDAASTDAVSEGGYGWRCQKE